MPYSRGKERDSGGNETLSSRAFGGQDDADRWLESLPLRQAHGLFPPLENPAASKVGVHGAEFSKKHRDHIIASIFGGGYR